LTRVTRWGVATTAISTGVSVRASTVASTSAWVEHTTITAGKRAFTTIRESSTGIAPEAQAVTSTSVRVKSTAGSAGGGSQRALTRIATADLRGIASSGTSALDITTSADFGNNVADGFVQFTEVGHKRSVLRGGSRGHQIQIILTDLSSHTHSVDLGALGLDGVGGGDHKVDSVGVGAVGSVGATIGQQQNDLGVLRSTDASTRVENLVGSVQTVTDVGFTLHLRSSLDLVHQDVVSVIAQTRYNLGGRGKGNVTDVDTVGAGFESINDLEGVVDFTLVVGVSNTTRAINNHRQIKSTRTLDRGTLGGCTLGGGRNGTRANHCGRGKIDLSIDVTVLLHAENEFASAPTRRRRARIINGYRRGVLGVLDSSVGIAIDSSRTVL